MGTVREAAYQLLRELGMTTIFGNPGSTELPFLHDMPEDFRYILALHERSAAGIGLGYALGKQTAAFVNLHSIASAGNGLSAIIDALYNHVPLVVTTGQQDRRQLLGRPFLESRAAEVVKPYVKWVLEPAQAEDVPRAIARAYYTAMEPPMGPVFLSIPMDDWTHSCAPVAPRQVRSSALADPQALDQVVSALNASGNPAVVVGSQIEEDDGWHQVIELAERMDADVYQEPIASRWTFPRTHPQFCGGLLPAERPLAEQLSPYDLVLVLGAPIFLYYSYVPGSPVVASTRLFQITNSLEDAASASSGTSIVGNIGQATSYILERTPTRAPRRVARAKSTPQPSPDYPIPSAFLFSTLKGVMPRNGVIVEECPSAKDDLDQYLKLDQPRSFYSVRSGILGFGVPAAIGLQLANLERRVTCLVGDGSLQYSIQALWTAVQYKAPVLFVVLHNSDYSALKSFSDFTQVGRNVPGVDLPGLNLVKLAEGYGMQAEQVDRPEQLADALKTSFRSLSPRLISVQVARGGTKCMGMDQSVNPPNYG